MNTISIKIKNEITGVVEVDSTIVVDKYDNDIISANHKAFSQIFPDSCVNFSWNNDTSFIFGRPYNQVLDESKMERGEMSDTEYAEKWYGPTILTKEEYTEDDHLMDFCENYAE